MTGKHDLKDETANMLPNIVHEITPYENAILNIATTRHYKLRRFQRHDDMTRQHDITNCEDLDDMTI